jgi:hypothetical protein
MTRQTRIRLLRRLEKARDAKLISYFTGDRQAFATQIGEDSVLLFREHLEKIGKVPRIDLLLYSRGGDMLTPLRIVRLIREHCDHFGVLIPYRAHSAATAVALGADEIVMGPLAELTPVDATTVHPFNPPDPTNPQQRLPISVEDINSFLALAREEAKIKDEQMVQVFNHLDSTISPLALGNAYRTIRMAQLAATKMLALHLDPQKDKDKIKGIVDKLTKELCLHAYPISRKEAKNELGLNVTMAAGELEKAIWETYLVYEDYLELKVPFNPAALLQGAGGPIPITARGAIIESIRRTDVFLGRGEVANGQVPNGLAGPILKMQPPQWEVEYP